MKRSLILLLLIALVNASCTSLPKSKVVNSTDNIERPEFNDDCVNLIKTGHNYLLNQQNIIEQKYQLGSYEKWYYDQTTGVLTFSDRDTIKLEIDYESVGSISKTSNTWLWAWNNSYIDKKVKSKIETIRTFGVKNDMEPLTKSKWKADEYDGWEMTGISAYLLSAKGAYRIPTDSIFAFVLFTEIRDLRK